MIKKNKDEEIDRKAKIITAIIYFTLNLLMISVVFLALGE